MKRQFLVVLGGMLLAGLVASSQSPFVSFLAFAQADCCGGEEQCYIPDFSLTPNTQKPVGTDSIRDAKHPGVKAACEAGITALGGNPRGRNSAGAIRDTVQKVFAGDYDAVTHIEVEFTPTIARKQDQTICPLTLTWKTRTVILLPANANDQMTKHEEGHQLIEEKVKELAKTRFAKVAGEKIVKKVLTDAQVTAILTPVYQTLEKIAGEASDLYDTKTNHGSNEIDAAGQATAASEAFDAAVAANPE